MSLDWNQLALADGLACYRAEQFFEAHEHWESVWMSLAEPEKTFLQALIHITVAFHHLQKGNAIGASRQLNRAMRKLEPYPAEFCDVQVEPLRQTLRAWRKSLEDGAYSKLPYPHIL